MLPCLRGTARVAPSETVSPTSSTPGDPPPFSDSYYSMSATVGCLRKGSSSGVSPSLFTHSMVVSGEKVCLKALHHNDQLYIFLNAASFKSMSKECLVSLLDYAEDTLGCKLALAFFHNNLRRELKKQICRDFSFFGFETVSSVHPSRPVGCEEYTFMVYDIDPGGEEGEETD